MFKNKQSLHQTLNAQKVITVGRDVNLVNNFIRSSLRTSRPLLFRYHQLFRSLIRRISKLKKQKNQRNKTLTHNFIEFNAKLKTQVVKLLLS